MQEITPANRPGDTRLRDDARQRSAAGGEPRGPRRSETVEGQQAKVPERALERWENEGGRVVPAEPARSRDA
jgi:hypothetical protein